MMNIKSSDDNKGLYDVDNDNKQLHLDNKDLHVDILDLAHESCLHRGDEVGVIVAHLEEPFEPRRGVLGALAREGPELLTTFWSESIDNLLV